MTIREYLEKRTKTVNLPESGGGTLGTKLTGLHSRGGGGKYRLSSSLRVKRTDISGNGRKATRQGYVTLS